MAEITINGVKFTNLPNKRTGVKLGNKISQSNFTGNLEEYLASPDFYKLLCAVDIDWNGIEVAENVIINDTAELINWIKSIEGQAGPTGPTGPQGPKGDTGPQGPTGAAGAAKLPDKIYNASAYSGLGRKTLELKNNSNILSQGDFNQENTIYIIQYDFDLGGENVAIPVNCVLEFDGGSLRNGTLIGNNTRLDGDFNRDCLYGVFYNMDGLPYDYTYKHVIGNPIYVDYIHSAVPNDEVSLNYQSIAVTDDYVFVLCEGTDYKLVIIMYDRETFSVIKIFNTDYSSHANTACVMKGDLLVGSSNGQTFFYRFNLSSLINAGLNNIECPVPEIVDCSEWSVIGETQSPFAFDYDEKHKELAIQFIKQGMDIYNPVNNKVFIFDEHYNYKRSTSNYIAGAFEKYKVSIGRQALVYKNGMCVIYAWISGNSSYRRPIIMYIDTLNDELIGVYNLPTKYTASEPEGAFRVGDDVWSIIASNGAAICKYSSRQPVLVRTQNNDDGNFIGNSGKLIHIYVDNTYNGIIEDGSKDYPFKSLCEALSVITTDSNTLTFHLKGTDNFYIGNFDLEGKSVQITSYESIAKLIPIGKFRNCNVDFSNVNLYCNSNYHTRYSTTAWYYMLVCYGCTVNTWKVHVYGEGGGSNKPGLYRGIFSTFNFNDVTVHNIRLLVFGADNYKGFNQVYLGKITVNDDIPDTYKSFILVRDLVDGSILHAISGFLDSTLNFDDYNRLAYGATFESPIILTNRSDVYNLIKFAARCNIYNDYSLSFYVIFNHNGDTKTTYESLPENVKSAVQTILHKTDEQLIGKNVLYRMGVYSFNGAEHNLCDELGNPILSCTNVSDNDISLNTLNLLCTNPTPGTRMFAVGVNRQVEWNGTAWVDYDGAVAGVARSGDTANRPLGSSIYVGFMFFDTSVGINKPIYASAISGDTVTWVDATGANV